MNMQSTIRTLSTAENEDHPIFGTLVEQLLHLLSTKLTFSDVIIHQNSPLMLRQRTILMNNHIEIGRAHV